MTLPKGSIIDKPCNDSGHGIAIAWIDDNLWSDAIGAS